MKPFRLPYVIVFCCILLVAGSSRAESLQGETLRVATYNVQFLPGMASAMNERKEPHYRAARIAEEMAAFDIVALQEVFHPRFRDLIVDGLREQWGNVNTVVSPKPEGQFNGGCLLATRLPIVNTGAMIFENYSHPDDYGVRADGYAAKGVIHARIARGDDNLDDTIDVFVTHLEARADHLRPLQYVEMAAFVREHYEPTRPALLMGDFNTNGVSAERDNPASQYAALRRELSGAIGEASLVDVWTQLEGDAYGGTTHQDSTERGKRIDLIFLANPPEPAVQLEPQRIWVNLYRDEKVVALSDHNAVEAELSWPVPR